MLETEFKVITGPPGANLSELTPDVDIKLPRTPSKRNSVCEAPDGEPKTPAVSGESNDAPAEATEVPAGGNNGTEETPGNDEEATVKTDWRVPAQIGVVLYNPDEPRTRWTQSSCHQFSSHNTDWGWTNFHGPWDQIHRRQHGQRQALLRNDTLSFDAYVRIFDDSTKSLWWHYSDSEPIWDSLSLIGYRPMGDPRVRFSHEVAGLASWVHLKPVRDIIRSVDYRECLRTPNVKPQPLCHALHNFLWCLENQDAKENLAINTDAIMSCLHVLDEHSSDVVSFWECMRRTLDLELADTDAAQELSKLFDSQPSGSLNTIPKDYNSRIRLMAETAESVQSGVTKYLESTPGKWSLPSIMHVDIARQKFDYNMREWKLIYDRVQIDEELDLSGSVDENVTGKYTLYGFIVHKGNRSSGMYHSILRPGGPDTHWLAFEDGDNRRIDCLTRKAAIGGHEGLTPAELKSSSKSDNPDVAVAVMYVRNDLVSQYLTGSGGSWFAEPPEHHFIPNLPTTDRQDGDPPVMVKVQAYRLDHDFSAIGTTMLDEHDLMTASTAAGNTITLDVPESTTISELRKKLTTLSSLDDNMVPNMRLWRLVTYARFSPYLAVLDDLDRNLKAYNSKIFHVWVHVLEDSKLFYCDLMSVSR